MTPSEPAKKDAPTYVSLRARTEAVKQQLKATGHYKAIDDLRLKERDVIRFELLEPGNVINGLAILEHPATTLLVPTTRRARVDERKFIWLENR